MMRFLRAGLLALVVMAMAPTAWADAASDRAERLGLANKLFSVMQGDEITEALRAMVTVMLPQESEMPTDEAARLHSAVTEATMEIMPRIFGAMAPVYADTFTTEELRFMLDFYDSETGRSIMRKTVEATPALNEAMMSVMPSLMSDMADTLCTHLECSAEERRQMKAGMAAAISGRAAD